VQVILAHEGQGSKLRRALRGDVKGWISIVLYAVAIPMAFFRQWIAGALYVTVALLWLIPDRRIEKTAEGKPV
jgi:uncharacterized membrane protein